MEKENKEIIEQKEQTEDDSKKNTGKGKKRFGRVKAYIKKHPYRILAVILLCIALFFILRETGVISKHVYEEVESLGEREGVCFDNLLLSCTIHIYNSSREFKHEHLCIFNTGDIYCFEWSESFSWHDYYYDDTSWSNTENVVYLGKLSNRDTSRLNQFVEDFDIDGGRYLMPDPGVELYDTGNKSEEISFFEISIFENQWKWSNYAVYIFQNDQQGESKGNYELIESCGMNHLFGDIYEKGEPWWKSYEENALAALKLFESSLFYYRWVFMCLHNG